MAESEETFEQMTMFEGHRVWKVETKLGGTVEIEGLEELPPYATVRLEVVAVVVDVAFKDSDNFLHRIQKLKIQTADLIETKLHVVDTE